MNANERDEISASVAAHAELGSRYDTAVAEGLVERIGDEIDRRIDARLGGSPQPVRRAPAPRMPLSPPAPEPAPPAAPAMHAHRSNGVTGLLLGLGSMGLGVGATAVVLGNHVASAAGVVMDPADLAGDRRHQRVPRAAALIAE